MAVQAIPTAGTAGLPITLTIRTLACLGRAATGSMEVTEAKAVTQQTAIKVAWVETAVPMADVAAKVGAGATIRMGRVVRGVLGVMGLTAAALEVTEVAERPLEETVAAAVTLPVHIVWVETAARAERQLNLAQWEDKGAAGEHRTAHRVVVARAEMAETTSPARFRGLPARQVRDEGPVAPATSTALETSAIPWSLPTTSLGRSSTPVDLSCSLSTVRKTWVRSCPLSALGRTFPGQRSALQPGTSRILFLQAD